MTTTIKSSFLIDDLLSAFKRPSSSTISVPSPATTVPPPLTPTHPLLPPKESLPLPSNDTTPISLNFFQPPNQFNQYAAIKPELHPFFFHGNFKNLSMYTKNRHSWGEQDRKKNHRVVVNFSFAWPLRRQWCSRQMMRWLMSLMNSYFNEKSFLIGSTSSSSSSSSFFPLSLNIMSVCWSISRK